jgi:hypothetical protein
MVFFIVKKSLPCNASSRLQQLFGFEKLTAGVPLFNELFPGGRRGKFQVKSTSPP